MRPKFNSLSNVLNMKKLTLNLLAETHSRISCGHSLTEASGEMYKTGIAICCASNSRSCPICQNDFVKDETVIRLECGHHLHDSECSQAYFADYRACAVCRFDGTPLLVLRTSRRSLILNSQSSVRFSPLGLADMLTLRVRVSHFLLPTNFSSKCALARFVFLT